MSIDDRLVVRCVHLLADAEASWRDLENFGLVSPGQSLEFTRLWIETQHITTADQFYLIAELDGAPLALLPLQLQRVWGVFRVLTWFPGSHVGSITPLVDRQRLADLSVDERAVVWRTLFGTVHGVDAIYLRNVPGACATGPDLFDGIGISQANDTLFRAEFSSWAEADRVQRSNSRRKHDRQQGDRLRALGTVAFEEIAGNSDAAEPVLEVMFRQRHERFVEMGVADPFTRPCVRAFYDRTVGPRSPLPVRLHVLRLDGEIVAVRHSIALGDTLFCLISSMSTDARLKPGSPGKQCLLGVMQTVFDDGWRVFDMGAGFTDEKRHWCNVQVALRNHYVALTVRGRAIAYAHRKWKALRQRLKSEKRSHAMIRKWRALRSRLTGLGRKHR